MLCSDGSASGASGSFGFIVSTKQGQRLAKGKGPAPGAYPNSFRSEAYGVLATLCWLYHALPTGAPMNHVTITHYLDNQSVISRIKSTHKQVQSFPNANLQAEHDVIKAIVLTLREIPLKIRFEWVQGHQDSHTPYRNLKLPAQMNCDADHEASQYKWPDNRSSLTVTPLPETPCQLIIQGKSITGHIKRRIREESTIPALKEHLKKKFEWDQSTLDAIDWPLYQEIITKYKSQRTTLVKHLHNISPTGHIANRNNEHLPHNCPACQAPHEDNKHVLTCNHQSRLEWRAETLQKIRIIRTHTFWTFSQMG